VDWGDGLNDRITSHDQAEATHVYDLGVFNQQREDWNCLHFYKHFTVTLTGVVNGICFQEIHQDSGVHHCAVIKQWGSARIDMPLKKKSRARRRLIFQRRPARRRLERELRVQINLNLAREALDWAQSDFDYVFNSEQVQYRNHEHDSYADWIQWNDSLYDRACENAVLEERRCSEILNMFVKWQPLGAEFKTNITCGKVRLKYLLGHALNRRLCWTPDDVYSTR